MAKVHICLDVIPHVAKLSKVCRFGPGGFLAPEMIFEHDLEGEIAWLADTEGFPIAGGFQRGERRADVRVQAPVSASYEDRIVIRRDKQRLWRLQVETRYGQLSLVEQLTDALGDGFDLGVGLVLAELDVAESAAVLGLARQHRL